MNETDFASYVDDNTPYVLRKLIQTNAISFVAQITTLIYLLKTKTYVTVHAKSPFVLDLIQNLPLTLTLMIFAKKQALN